MRVLTAMAFTFLWLGLSGPGAAHTPPVPAPSPAQLEAARSFVRSLPIEKAMISFVGSTPARAELERALAERAAGLEPGSRPEEISNLVSSGVSGRIDRYLPAILPEAAEAMAVDYAREFSIQELEAASRFFGSSGGRAMAVRFVSFDPVVSLRLRSPLYRSIDPELAAIVAEAKSREQLRRRVNAR